MTNQKRDDNRPDPLKAINTTITPPDMDLKGPDSDVSGTPHERVDVGDKEHGYHRAGNAMRPIDEPDEDDDTGPGNVERTNPGDTRSRKAST
ncbi:MAG: hypothetical protein QOE14_2063 [Humisphaera sp.]|nr:hypothetical protein [Humisphaera sp.]